MPDAATANGTQQSHAFDPAVLKKDIMDAMSAKSDSTRDAILSAVKSQLEGFKPAAKEKTVKSTGTHNEDLNDLREEMSELGIDDKTAGALQSMMSKVLSKKSGDIKSEVKGEIELSAKAKEVKQGWDALAVKNFPSIQNADSMLAKEATKIYQNNLSKECKNSPEGSIVAILLASLMTGERPTTLEDIRQSESRNEGSGNKGGSGEKEVESSKVDALAKGFGLDPASVQAKLKLIKNKQQFK